MPAAAERILILRFSSFGDITQALSIPAALKKRFPEAEVHWATRSDFAGLIENHPAVDKLWTLDQKSGLKELWQLSRKLKRQSYTHIYDAHNSLRSRLLCALLRPKKLCRKSSFRLRRFLLFRLRINTYPQPFSGQRDLLSPLKKWDIPSQAPSAPQLFIPESVKHDRHKQLVLAGYEAAVVLAPSAAHLLKRWPLIHWQKLIELMPEQKFILLGGPTDHFIAEIAAVAPDRCLNLTGQCSLLESSAVVASARALVANDTGLLHVGEQLGKPTIALMGPAPFGFPSRPSTRIMEIPLKCRPCSKHGQGPCINPEYQKCLVDIRPEEVALQLQQILRAQS